MAVRSRTPRRLNFSGFSTTEYPGLNGAHVLSATKLDIERSMLMVGYPTTRDAIAVAGPWRARLLSALVEGYLTPTLATTRYFHALEPSERVSMTFLLAQAFTHWAAGFYLGIPILLHVSGASVSYAVASTAVPSKTGAGPQKNKSRPDFFGIAPGEVHVFEAKGRSLPLASKTVSKTLSDALMPAALAQVSRISTVNGLNPKTRSAACWIFRHGRSHGFLQDPPAADVSYDVTIDLREVLLHYYKLAIDLAADANPSRGVRHMRLPLDDRRTLFVDRTIGNALRSLEQGEITGEDFLAKLAARRETFERARRLTKASSSISLGLDGVGLMANGVVEGTAGEAEVIRDE